MAEFLIPPSQKDNEEELGDGSQRLHQALKVFPVYQLIES